MRRPAEFGIACGLGFIGARHFREVWGRVETLGIFFAFFGDGIIKEGETDYSLFVLLKGVVAIVKNNPRQVTITKLKAGAIFGEIAYVAKRKRTTSVIADGDVIALRIDTKNIDVLN